MRYYVTLATSLVDKLWNKLLVQRYIEQDLVIYSQTTLRINVSKSLPTTIFQHEQEYY